MSTSSTYGNATPGFESIKDVRYSRYGASPWVLKMTPELIRSNHGGCGARSKPIPQVVGQGLHHLAQHLFGVAHPQPTRHQLWEEGVAGGGEGL